MSRRLSMNARQAVDEPVSSEIELVLLEITHPQLSAPIRLSTDNTERLSDEPLIYGTRSSWRGAKPDTEPFYWVLAAAVVPGDDEAAPAAAQIVLENLDSEITHLLRSFTDPATIAMAVVLASSPSLIEAEWADLQLTSAEGSASEIILTISREEIENEYFPSGRMTRQRFPGLHQ